MSDEQTEALDDLMEGAPVEDYSGDDTSNAGGTVAQPGDEADAAADEAITDATEPPTDSSRDG